MANTYLLPQAIAATMGPQLPQQQAPAMPPGFDPNDPLAAQIAALQTKLAQPLQRQFTPEQVAQRRADNERQYQLGILGQLSGDQDAGQIGGQVLKQALAARAPKITERGTADPITGEFSYDPDYLRTRDESALTGLQTRQAQMTQQRQMAREAQQARAEQQRQHDADQRALHAAIGGSNEPLVQVVDDAGNITYVRRSQAVGQKAPPKGGGGQPSEGERNAAGFSAIMGQAAGIIDSMEQAGRGTRQAQVLHSIPLMGDSLALGAMTPAQQQYAQAAQAWVRAKLRKESGAAIGKDEMAGEIRTFFPQPGEGPEVVAQKKLARELANRAMTVSAGRAQVPSLDTAPPAPAMPPGGGPAMPDPLGLRR